MKKKRQDFSIVEGISHQSEISHDPNKTNNKYTSRHIVEKTEHQRHRDLKSNERDKTTYLRRNDS